MVDKTTTANVGVNINPQGMAAAARQVEQRIEAIAAKISQAGQAANAQLKAMAIGLKQVQTLQNYSSQRMMGDFQNSAGIGKRARAFAEYGRAIDATANSMDILRGRARAMDVEFGNLAKRGVKLNNSDLMNARRIDDTAKAYGQLTNQVGALRTRIGQLSEGGQRAFQPMLRSLEEMDRKNAKLFANPNLFDFRKELGSSQQLVQNLRERVSVREKIEAKTRLNVEALREEARQILNVTNLERQAQLAKSTRAGGTAIRNRELIGEEGPYRRQIDLTQRLATQNNYLKLSKAQLNAEYMKPVEQQNAARINQLLGRYKMLQREIGETIALRNREMLQESKNKGGFFAGMKSIKGSLFDSGGGEQGMFGAGALVGRVAAYAVAASAIYGLITSIQQGVVFTIQFEDALAQLQAISGSTTTEMERLSAGILEVSKNSASSVMELTQAATVIAQAGYAGAEIQTLLQSAVNLAAASGSTASESVDILTSALGSFQLSASEASRVTDALVASLNDSKLSVNQVQLGLQYVGATARENNITFNELVSTLGAMADAGIRSGSTMSTGLRQMLVDFIDPSEKLIDQLTKVGLTTADIDVKTLGLSEVLTRLRDSGFQAYGTLETRAAAAYAVLSANIDQMATLEQATLRQNAAQEAAAVRIDSVAARWQRLLNTLSELGAAIGDALTPLVKGLISLLTSLVTIVSDLIIPIAKAVELVTSLGGSMTSTQIAGEDFHKTLMEMGASSEEASGVIEELGGSIEDLETVSKDAKATMETLRTEEASLRSETEKLILRKDDLAGSTEAVRDQVNILASRFPGLREEFSKTEGGIDGLISAMMRLEFQAQKTLAAQARVVMATESERIREANTNAKDVQAKLTQRLGFIAGRPYASREEQQLANELRELVQNRYWDRAYDKFEANNGRGLLGQDYRLKDLFGEVIGFRSQFESSTASFNAAKGDLGRSTFLMTDDGQRVVQIVRNNQQGYRADSQGNYGNKSRATVENQMRAELSELRTLLEEAGNNPYARDVISSAISSKNAVLASMAPDPVEEKRKRGGKSAAERRADRLDRDFERNQSRIEKEELEYQKKLYENSVTAFENAPTLAELPETLDEIDANLSRWLNAENEAAVQSIMDATNGTDPRFAKQRQQMLEAASRKAEELRVEQIDKLGDTLARVLEEYIDTTTASIERNFQEAMRFTEQNLAIAQGRLRGLSNPVRNADTPDYMRTVVQRQVDVAQDRRDVAQIGANSRRIEQLQALAERVRQEKEDIEARLSLLGKMRGSASTPEEIVVIGERASRASMELRGIDEKLLEIDSTTRDLIDTNAALGASYAVLGEVPTTFGQGLGMAVEAMKIELNAANNLGQELIKNLDQPLRALHQSFKGFFSDLLSGTVSVGDAFTRMASTIIDAILEMVATALATQFFKIIAGAIGGGVPAFNGGSVAGDWGSGVIPAGRMGPPTWNGGPVEKKFSGGDIRSGLPTRDSTLIHAAKGEYVVRRAAAQSLGKGFLDAINARGAHALQGMGQNIINMPQVSQQPVNVYVVAPEEKPTMGPNDVLATFSNDVLRGGVTKKLIKQVAAGG